MNIWFHTKEPSWWCFEMRFIYPPTNDEYLKFHRFWRIPLSFHFDWSIEVYNKILVLIFESISFRNDARSSFANMVKNIPRAHCLWSTVFVDKACRSLGWIGDYLGERKKVIILLFAMNRYRHDDIVLYLSNEDIRLMCVCVCQIKVRFPLINNRIKRDAFHSS